MRSKLRISFLLLTVAFAVILGGCASSSSSSSPAPPDPPELSPPASPEAGSDGSQSAAGQAGGSEGESGGGSGLGEAPETASPDPSKMGIGAENSTLAAAAKPIQCFAMVIHERVSATKFGARGFP